ncbi:MAG: peptidylprolyl isomerase [Syntrophobacteraceae bacterium]|jgi:peptidyl-prolyl cis-trans isomerase SurA
MGSFSKVAILTVCAIAVGLLAGSTAHAETVDRIVANVNGEIILYSELQEQLKLLGKYAPDVDLTDPAKKSQIEHDVLTQLIRQKLTEAEAKRLQVMVLNAEVENTLSRMMEENHTNLAQLEVSLKANGQSVEKLRTQIKKDLERNRLMDRVLKSKVLITDKQVEDFLKGDKAGPATTTQKIHLGLIALPANEKSEKPEAVQKTGREILDKLKQGADFQAMAKQYSKGNTAKDGGDIGYMAPEELAPFIAKAIKDLKKGEVSDLVQGPGGYYIIKVLDVDTKKLSSSDPGTREKVRNYLYEQEVNRKFEEWVHGLEAKAFIQITL